jgi:hypothetical protein
LITQNIIEGFLQLDACGKDLLMLGIQPSVLLDKRCFVTTRVSDRRTIIQIKRENEESSFRKQALN